MRGRGSVGWVWYCVVFRWVGLDFCASAKLRSVEIRRLMGYDFDGWEMAKE